VQIVKLRKGSTCHGRKRQSSAMMEDFTGSAATAAAMVGKSVSSRSVPSKDGRHLVGLVEGRGELSER